MVKVPAPVAGTPSDGAVTGLGPVSAPAGAVFFNVVFGFGLGFFVGVGAGVGEAAAVGGGGVVALGAGVASFGGRTVAFETGLPQPAGPSAIVIPAANTAVHRVLRGNIHPPIGPSPIESSRGGERRQPGPAGSLSPDRTANSAAWVRS